MSCSAFPRSRLSVRFSQVVVTCGSDRLCADPSSVRSGSGVVRSLVDQLRQPWLACLRDGILPSVPLCCHPPVFLLVPIVSLTPVVVPARVTVLESRWSVLLFLIALRAVIFDVYPDSLSRRRTPCLAFCSLLFPSYPQRAHKFSSVPLPSPLSQTTASLQRVFLSHFTSPFLRPPLPTELIQARSSPT